jgi:hypothetical protein
MSFDAWKNADPDTKPGDGLEFDPPKAEGQYTVTLTDAHAGISPKNDGVFVVLTFETHEREPFAWKDWYGFVKNDGTPNKGAANAAKRQARALGVDIDSISSVDELADKLKARVGGYYEGVVKWNGKFGNFFVDGPASSQPPASDLGSPTIGEPATVPTDDSHVPF